MDFDVIVVGGGPAGLSAAAELVAAQRRVLVIDRESFGGQVGKLEWVEGYPGPGERIEGPRLANQLVDAAAGARMELGEVIEIESYSGCRSVTCADGKAYTAPVVVLASGLQARPLGIPGEDKYQGKGMIHCAFCDGGFYTGKPVAVVGGGDAGVREALYLARFASVVHLIETRDQLSALPQWQGRAKAEGKIELHIAQRPVAIEGGDFVTAIEIEHHGDGRREKLAVHGVLVHAGFDAAGAGFEGVVSLDDKGFVEVNDAMETDNGGLLAAGDVRSGAARQVAQAVRDGRIAAQAAMAALQAA